MSGPASSWVGRFATRYARVIVFIVLALCVGGVYAASTMPSSVFPQTNFPRVVILVDNGVMPSDEMMARITRPIEESMKDVPGCVSVKSATGRGSAEVNVFFRWDVDMVQSELYVLSRLGQIRTSLPEGAETNVFRLTFTAFPILGISLTSPQRNIEELWEEARYDLKPRFLRIPGVARVDLVGGRTPELQVVVDPTALASFGLALTDVSDAIAKSNVVEPAGMHEENDTLYLVVTEGRVATLDDVANLVVADRDGRAIRVHDFAEVKRAPEPAFNVVTADGNDAVLLNIRSQADGSTLQIAAALQDELSALRRELPPDMKLAFFYDQSLLVRESVGSVWEAVGFGLLLSVAILYLFLRNWGTTLVATLVIPVTVLFTIVAMNVAGMSFNLMTLGGFAAAIGLVVDDAIVVVEAIYTKMSEGLERSEAVEGAVAEILIPLAGSTLTPVVVFIPLAFLDGLTGVFFRALALTMVVALLTSLVLAVTLTPTLATWLIRVPKGAQRPHDAHEHAEKKGGFIGGRTRLYEAAMGAALKHPWATVGLSLGILVLGGGVYSQLESDFLPSMDEGAFVIDYTAPPGTSLTETSRELGEAEKILLSMPEVESYSRRTGARLALAIAEPNTGDFLVKLKASRERATEDVIADLRARFNVTVPGIEWEFPGILGDLIGDLMWAPSPIEIKLFSTDPALLKAKAPQVEAVLQGVPGVVDAFDGLVEAGPSIDLHVRDEDARRFGLDADLVAKQVSTALLGETASSLLEGDRVVGIRVRLDPKHLDRVATLRELALRAPDGRLVLLHQVADIREVPGQLELRREDLRQDVAVTARLEHRSLGSAMDEIRQRLAKDPTIPSSMIEYGGLYQQQQESFKNLLIVLFAAIFLVFTVLLFEFRSFQEPCAILFGAVLALFGSIAALWVTGTSLNVISFLGAIIGVGIVAKNGILMLDLVEHLRAEGLPLSEAIIRSGRRRLRPVLMTSMAAALGMLPLAYGIGSGADMLRPLAIAVIGALLFSDMLSLVATPTVYYLLKRDRLSS